MTISSPAPSAAQAGLVKDTTTTDFRRDVLQESMNQPVLVDFWAPWCGPCKQLGPMIEKLVTAAKGKVKLVKMNIDQYPEVAGQLGVQSIPAVFAFDRGQPVDGFVGNLPESQIKGFIERLTGPMGQDSAALIAEGNRLLESGDTGGAAEIFAGLLAQEAENPEALAGLMRAYIAAQALEQAQGLAASLSPALAAHPALVGAKAALVLAEQAQQAGDIAPLQNRLTQDPADFAARFDLAMALGARNRRAEAVEHLIVILKKDREWNDQAARKQLLQFFEAWGPGDPATLSGRRQLSATLFS